MADFGNWIFDIISQSSLISRISIGIILYMILIIMLYKLGVKNESLFTSAIVILVALTIAGFFSVWIIAIVMMIMVLLIFITLIFRMKGGQE